MRLVEGKYVLSFSSHYCNFLMMSAFLLLFICVRVCLYVFVITVGHKGVSSQSSAFKML